MCVRLCVSACVGGGMGGGGIVGLISHCIISIKRVKVRVAVVSNDDVILLVEGSSFNNVTRASGILKVCRQNV